MFNEEEQATGLGGITVKDAWIALQLLDKATSNGIIQSVELSVVGEWRKNLTDAIKRAIGKDFDQLVVEYQQAMLKLQAEQKKEHTDDEEPT